MKYFITFLAAAFFLVLYASPASATVTSVTATPPHVNIAFSPATNTFTVTWVITRTTTGGPVNLVGSAGQFKYTAVGSVLATTPVRTRIIPGNPGTITFVETAVVPQFVMRAALGKNQGQFVYERSFADDGSFIKGSITLNTAGGMGGPLGLASVNISFPDDSTFRTVAKGAVLTAKARIHSNGTGQLGAVWEVSDSGNPDGTAFYHALRTVHVTLSGQQQVVVVSPPLPTSQLGRVNVRFRVTDPPEGIINPVITYFVTDGGASGENLPVIGVSSPETNAAVGSGTTFKWHPVKDAVVYRLQVLDGGGSSAASMLVKDTDARLSAFVLGQLQYPANYKWRIVAINKGGDSIAASAPRSFRFLGK